MYDKPFGATEPLKPHVDTPMPPMGQSVKDANGRLMRSTLPNKEFVGGIKRTKK